MFFDLTQSKDNDEILGNIDTILENHEEELDSRDTLISSPPKIKITSNSSLNNLLAPSLAISIGGRF